MTKQLILLETKKTNPPFSNSEGMHWLGIRLDHRQLFNALEAEYISPHHYGNTLLGVDTYTATESQAYNSNLIYTFLRIDLASLPNATVRIYKDDAREEIKLSDIVHFTGWTVVWSTFLPTYCIYEIAVESLENLNRLSGLSRLVSNIQFPTEPLKRENASQNINFCTTSNDELHINSPDNSLINSWRGGLCMAFWGVPHVEPWIAGLLSSLAPSGVKDDKIDANLPNWYKHLPWDANQDLSNVHDLDSKIWSAASNLLISYSSTPEFCAHEFLDTLCTVLSNDASKSEHDWLNVWRLETDKILYGKEEIHIDSEPKFPVAVSIQLLLLRIQPEDFKTWIHLRPDLPPPVWIAATILCGIFNGYNHLPISFRGNSSLRKLTLLHFLSSTNCKETLDEWPGAPKTCPSIVRDGRDLNLSWCGVKIGTKHEKSRGTWYKRDLTIPEVRSEAIQIAQRLGWKCLNQCINLSSGNYSFTEGPNSRILIDRRRHVVSVSGSFVQLSLPKVASSTLDLDDHKFRNSLLLLGGVIPADTSNAWHLDDQITYSIKTSTESLADKANHLPNSNRVPGLRLVEDFVSSEDEINLVKLIDSNDWNSDMDRRVQHFGWRYDYKSRRIDTSLYLGVLPEWANRIAARLYSEGLTPKVADQVIVNEYIGKQGISAHIDCLDCFEDGIAIVSLLESWEMVFKKNANKNKLKAVYMLPRRSAILLSGESRYAWTHEIPKRISEPKGLKRGRRLSLTFRKVSI